MESFDFVVQSPVGIHARPAMLLAREAKSYQDKITIRKGSRVVNAKNIVLLLSLGAHKGDCVTFIIEGENEAYVAKRLEQFCEVNL